MAPLHLALGTIMAIKGPKLGPYGASILEIDTDDEINILVNIRV